MEFTTKHPRKKRRIDGNQEATPGPSSAVLPLVAPQLVRKSSKDPNRGMYPSFNRKSNSSNQASSAPKNHQIGFVKASELIKRTPQSIETSVLSDCVVRDEISTEENLSEINKPSNSGSSNGSSNSKRQLFSSKIRQRKHKTSISSNNSAVRITKYFKPDIVKSNHSRKSIVSSQCETKKLSRSENWNKKDEEFLETIRSSEQFFKRYQDCYGLVENSASEKDTEDYFSFLPTHIIEIILCQLPYIDLMACRDVCSRWQDIIDNQKFMEWKKLYYGYKAAEPRIPVSIHQSKLLSILESYNFNSVDACIDTLTRFMGEKFNRLPSHDMYMLLVQNPHGELADHVLNERFPEWNKKESRVWCQFTIAVLICETVWDIISLYKSLFNNRSSCGRPDVIDALYCIGTFLLYFRVAMKINYGLPYRVYYALYVIENNIPRCQKIESIQNLPGQQSIHNYGKRMNKHLTYEQLRILNHRFDVNQKIKIVALAGTGKTTTLVHLAQLYPEIKFLNLVFNKTVNEEAKKKFPPNVVCKTAHGLAYGAIGRLFQHKLTSTLRPYDLQNFLTHNEGGIRSIVYATLVFSTIKNYITSNCIHLSLEHVPSKDNNQMPLPVHVKERVLKDAEQIWEKMKDQENDFKITHDVYLKLYHLKKPKFRRFQCIMVDEAQDCNPVILDIVLSQNMPVIFVGDPYQQIYHFRGATNALQSIDATHTYYLTKSFRFGPEISYVASCLLETMKSKDLMLVGNSNDSNLQANTIGQYAVIARTNVSLFNEALRIVVLKQLKPYEPSVVHATFAGGINSYGFDQIADIYKLQYLNRGERKMKDHFIGRFKTFHDLVKYAKDSDDIELLSKIEIVNQHGPDVATFLKILQEKCTASMETANVIFSTAHKSKGLEFDTVALTDDYHIPYILTYEPHEELNILYVAITRAKKCLLLPEKMTKILHFAHEKFEYPVSSKALSKNNAQLKCVICSTSFIPHTTLLMMRRKTILASGREITEGPLCMKCGSDPHTREDVHMNGLVMYLDPERDNCHRFMSRIAGPLPTDPPIIYDRFMEFENADRVFVINLNMH